MRSGWTERVNCFHGRRNAECSNSRAPGLQGSRASTQVRPRRPGLQQLACMEEERLSHRWLHGQRRTQQPSTPLSSLLPVSSRGHHRLRNPLPMNFRCRRPHGRQPADSSLLVPEEALHRTLASSRRSVVSHHLRRCAALRCLALPCLALRCVGPLLPLHLHPHPRQDASSPQALARRASLHLASLAQQPGSRKVVSDASSSHLQNGHQNASFCRLVAPGQPLPARGRCAKPGSVNRRRRAEPGVVRFGIGRLTPTHAPPARLTWCRQCHKCHHCHQYHRRQAPRSRIRGESIIPCA